MEYLRVFFSYGRRQWPNSPNTLGRGHSRQRHAAGRTGLPARSGQRMRRQDPGFHVQRLKVSGSPLARSLDRALRQTLCSAPFPPAFEHAYRALGCVRLRFRIDRNSTRGSRSDRAINYTEDGLVLMNVSYYLPSLLVILKWKTNTHHATLGDGCKLVDICGKGSVPALHNL